MILDALKYLIQADTRDATKGISDMRKSTDDLTESMVKTEKQADSATDKISGLAKGVIGLLGVTASAAGLLAASLTRVQEVADMQRLADSIGVSVSEVDALGGAFERAGSSAASANDLMLKLTEGIGKGLQDVKSKEAQTFSALGISLKNAQGQILGADEAVLKMAGSLEGMGAAAARVALVDLGITDPKTIELMLKGRQELERLVTLQKNQGVVSKESGERARQFSETLDGLRTTSGRMVDGFLDKFIPALTTMIQWLSKVIDFAAEHKDAVVGFLMAIAGVVTYFYLPAMLSAAAATLAATWPILAIGAAIALAAAAFALIYDDIVNFIEGNDSMIGQIFTKYPAVEKAVRSLISVFQEYWKAVKWVFEQSSAAIASFSDTSLKVLDAMGKGVRDIFKWLVDAITGSMKFITDSLATIKNTAKAAGDFLGITSPEQAPADPSTFGPEVPNVPAPSQSRYGSAVPDVPLSMQAANAQLANAANSPVNHITSNTISNSARGVSNNETNVAVGQVTVQTQATDASGIAGSINSELSDQLKNLASENASGVAR